MHYLQHLLVYLRTVLSIRFFSSPEHGSGSDFKSGFATLMVRLNLLMGALYLVCVEYHGLFILYFKLYVYTMIHNIVQASSTYLNVGKEK